jgi:uncharacterized repeat protein (TIGR01451 family)
LVPGVRRALLVAAGCALLLTGSGFTQTEPAAELASVPGGFLETATTGQVRPRLSASVLQTLLPARGAFTFPAPYGTRAARLTNASDCGGADCLHYVGYSYWRNINAHAGSNEMLIFLGLKRSGGGAGPSLFRYDKTTEQVTNLGPLFDAASGFSWHTGEGWYWSATQPTKLYIQDNARMLRYDVISKQFQTVFDVSAQFGADKYIWQMHSSDDDRVHSATLRSNPSYEMLGCVVYREDIRQFLYYPKIGDFDECQIDKSGRYLVSKENVDGQYDVEMRVFDLQSGTERLVWDQNGAVGHSDMGHGYVVGADNWDNLPNAVKLWEFGRDPLAGQLVSHTTSWAASAPNHIAHGNARPGVSPAQQYACGSGASRADAPWANEIICFRLDGSLQVLVVAPVMTDLDAAGGGDDYSKMPKGNLDVTGQYFIWTSNTGGGRLDAFVVKVPAQLLMGGTPDTVPPVIAAVGAASLSSSGATLTWTTDEPGDSQVEYGPTTSYGSATVLNATPLVAHSQTLSGLAAGTLYHYRVKSRDAAGNLGVSGDFTLTTLPDTPPPPPPGSGPLGHWKLDEGSGTLAADASGNGRSGVLVNGPAWVAGRIDQALSFDGVDDYVQVAHAGALDAYPLTVAVWFKTGATGLHGLVNKYFPSSWNGYQLFMLSGNLCAWYFRDASNNTWDGSTCTLMTPGFADDRWHQAAFVVDDAGGRLYVDGVLKAGRAWTGTPGPPSTTLDLSFGAYPGTAAPYLPGALDDVRLYARALSPSEIAVLAGPADVTAPSITAVGASNVSTSGATLAWTTDEPADSQVEYGPTTSYGSVTTLDTTPLVAHSQTLSGLAPGTMCHYRVKSRDAAGNLGISGDHTFTTAVPGSPVLAISKSDSPDPVGAGANLTYTLSYSNTGNASATGVVITDTVPVNTTFVSATGGGSLSGGVVTWSLGTLAAGASGTVQMVVRVKSPLANNTTITNAAYGIDSNETALVGGAAVTTTVTSSPLLSVSAVDSPDPVNAGANLTYTLSCSNSGNANATGVVITDTVPVNTSFVSATGGGVLSGGVVTWTIGTLAAGASGSIQMVVRVVSPLANNTTIQNAPYTIDSSETAVVSGAAVTTTAKSAPGLRLGKKHSPNTVASGADLMYTITYSNTGNADATDVLVTDAVPANTTFVAATAGGLLASGTVTWNLGTLPAGASGSVQMAVRVATGLANGTVITSDAYRITSNETGPIGGPADAVTVFVGTSPTVSSVVELATNSIYVLQSGVHVIRVNGANFQDRAFVGLGADISTGPTVFIGSGRLDAAIAVSATAPLGARTVTVTNPDLGSGSRAGALIVVRTTDVNGDCLVDGSDLNLLARAWNTTSTEPGFNPAADLDGDGVVGPVDLSIFTKYFGRRLAACP